MFKKTIIYIIVLFIFLSGCSLETNEENMDIYENYWKNSTSENGLMVDKNGIIKLCDREFYGAGVNCYNLFLQCVNDNYSIELAKETLKKLKENDIPFVRFTCLVYYYDEIYKYMDNKEKYLNLICQIVELAENMEIGLIISFFWHNATIPDYFDEPFKAWGNNKSKTYNFVYEFTSSVVELVKNKKSVWGYEFGNEFTLSCDLPNAKELIKNYPLPIGSSRVSRDETDYLSIEDINAIYNLFSNTVKEKVNTNIMISSGDASMRPSQYNQYKYGTWEQDTKEERILVTQIITPLNLNTISEHVYFLEQKTFNEILDVDNYIKEIKNISKQLKKAYIIGEWGGDFSEDFYQDIRYFADCIIKNKVQVSMFWNYNLTDSIEHSFIENSEKGQYIFGQIRRINSQIN